MISYKQKFHKEAHVKRDAMLDFQPDVDRRPMWSAASLFP